MELKYVKRMAFVAVIVFIVNQAWMALDHGIIITDLQTDQPVYHEHENASITASLQFPRNKVMGNYMFKWTVGFNNPFIMDTMYVSEDGIPEEDDNRYNIRMESDSTGKGVIIIDINDLTLEDQRVLKLRVIDKETDEEIDYRIVELKVDEEVEETILMTILGTSHPTHLSPLLKEKAIRKHTLSTVGHKVATTQQIEETRAISWISAIMQELKIRDTGKYILLSLIIVMVAYLCLRSCRKNHAETSYLPMKHAENKTSKSTSSDGSKTSSESIYTSESNANSSDNNETTIMEND